MPSMPSPGVYAFEAIEADLPFMPLAARRVLDALGRKMSLEAWLSLSLADRQRICQAGARALVEADLLGIIDKAVPAPQPMPPLLDPDETAPPPGARVRARAPRGRSTCARWRALRALDRYALCKYAGKPAKLARAYDEIVGAGPATAAHPPRPFGRGAHGRRRREARDGASRRGQRARPHDARDRRGHRDRRR